MSEGELADLPTKAIQQLGLPQETTSVLVEIQAELTAAYQKNFIKMVDALNRQASAIDRLQATLTILVERFAPELKGQIPAALRIAAAGESPDVASALVVADPVGAGYTMTQAALAETLGISSPDVSVLSRAFKLPDDAEAAVVVRRGSGNKVVVVNYHPRAVERFMAHLKNPPTTLNPAQRACLERVRKKLLLDTLALAGSRP